MLGIGVGRVRNARFHVVQKGSKGRRVVPAQIVAEEREIVGIVVAHDGFHGSLVTGRIVESGIVPRVVGHAEKRHFRHFALLHRVADDAYAARQFRGNGSVAIDGRHFEEIGIHILRVNLAVAIVVAGIVPPPRHIALEILPHFVEVAAIGNAPNAPARRVNRHVFRSRRQSLIKSGAGIGAHPAQGVDLRHEMHGANRVGRGSARLVVFFLKTALHSRQVVGIELVFAAIGQGYVIDENGELAHAESIHLVEFSQNIVHHRATPNKIISRVNRPNEIHLRRCRLRRDFAQHRLRQPTVFLLFGGDARRIRFGPFG